MSTQAFISDMKERITELTKLRNEDFDQLSALKNKVDQADEEITRLQSAVDALEGGRRIDIASDIPRPLQKDPLMAETGFVFYNGALVPKDMVPDLNPPIPKVPEIPSNFEEALYAGR